MGKNPKGANLVLAEKIQRKAEGLLHARESVGGKEISQKKHQKRKTNEKPNAKTI